MTIAQIYEKAKQQLDKDEITIGEFSEIVDREYQESSDDCISREEALKVMCDNCPMYNCVCRCSSYRHMEKMPSVTPQPKIGHWEYVKYDNNPYIGNWHCSECRGICTEMHSIEDAYNYCPNCGAKMEVEE